MPDVVSAVVATVKAVGFFLKTTAIIHQSINLLNIARLAMTVGAFSYSRNRAKKALRGLGTLDTGRMVSVREPAAPRAIIYGQMRVGGTIVFAHVSGSSNEYLHLVIAHAGHECEEIGDVYLNDEVVPLDGSGNATGRYAGFVRVKKHLGADSQTVDTDLQTDVGSGTWSNDHRLRGICYSYVRLKHSQDLFPAGLPNYSAVIKGRKVYDPRGPSTAWSANAALCLRDYLTLSQDRGGIGADSSEVDDTALAAAANICEESVNLNPSGTESRYTVNGVVDTSAEPGAVLQALAGAMAGVCPFIGGKFKPKAGAHTPSVLSLGEDDVRGGVRFSTRDSLRNAFNGVKGTYVSAKTDYQIADFPAVVNSTYTTEDGGVRLWRDLALNFTTSSGMAQRLAKIELERSRQDIVVTLRTSMKAVEAHVGDVVDLTLARYGWSAKLFEVVDCRFVVDEGAAGPTLGLEWTLRETASGVWDWNSGEETTVDLAPNTTLVDPFTVPTPSGLTLTAGYFALADGTLQPRLRVQWSAPASALVTGGGLAVIEYRKTGASTWLEWAKVRGDLTEDYITDVETNVGYDVRMKFVNVRRVEGAYSSTATATMVNINLLSDLSNLAYNPTFSQGDVGWISDDGNSFTIASNKGETGWGAERAGSGEKAVRNNFKVQVSPGDRLHYLCHAKGTNGHGRVTCYDSANNELFYADTPNAGGSSWKWLETFFTVPQGVAWVRAEFVGDSTSCAVDAVKLLRIPPNVTYVEPETKLAAPYWDYEDTGGGNREVTLSHPDGSATLKYTVNGGSTNTYSAPFTVSAGDTVKAWAERGGYTTSENTVAPRLP